VRHLQVKRSGHRYTDPLSSLGNSAGLLKKTYQEGWFGK